MYCLAESLSLVAAVESCPLKDHVASDGEEVIQFTEDSIVLPVVFAGVGGNENIVPLPDSISTCLLASDHCCRRDKSRHGTV